MVLQKRRAGPLLTLNLFPLGFHLAFDSRPQAVFEVLGNGLRLHTFVDLKSLHGGVHDDKTVGTLAHVALQVALGFQIDTRIQIIVEFLQKLLTG
jgi:hypothetical protein